MREEQLLINEGSIWFRRFYKDVKRMSPHFYFRPINFGWYRIYWTGGGEPAYVHEVWKWMPYKGYDVEEKDFNLDSKQYFEEYEDQLEISRKIKNFVEGYWDSRKTMMTRMYMLKNDKSFREEATKAYRTIRLK